MFEAALGGCVAYVACCIAGVLGVLGRVGVSVGVLEGAEDFFAAAVKSHIYVSRCSSI